MLIRITRGSFGISNYLRNGKRSDSKYTRAEKDSTMPLYGNLNTFEKTEKYLKTKNYKDNYLHITIGFSEEDIQSLNKLGGDKKYKKMQEIAQDCIKHHTKGYDLDNEVIAYSEAHIPKILEEHGKKRLDHIHIAIALYNPISDTKLRPNFAKALYIDDTFQSYMNEKYRLTQPKRRPRPYRKKEYSSKVTKDREYYLEKFKPAVFMAYIGDLIEKLDEENIKYKIVETAKNKYVKIITEGNAKNINIRGKGFEHLEGKRRKDAFEPNEDIKSLKSILDSYYEKRITEVEQRRSQATKDKLEKIHSSEYFDFSSTSTLDTNTEDILLEKAKEESKRPTSPLEQEYLNRKKEKIKLVAKQQTAYKVPALRGMRR